MTSIQAADRALTVTVERPPRRARALSQYWDHRTVSWQVTSPVPVPRRGA